MTRKVEIIIDTFQSNHVVGIAIAVIYLYNFSVPWFQYIKWQFNLRQSTTEIMLPYLTDNGKSSSDILIGRSLPEA